MYDNQSEADLRRLAERRAGAKFGFYVHALVYLVVNAGLVAINLATSPQALWFVWPMFGWGIGLVAHGLGVFAHTSGLRERAIAAEMKRLRAR
jgi:hypothetical protein